MKKLFSSISILLAALVACSSAQAQSYAYDPNFSDLTLINCGNGAKRAAWTKADFEPYLTHKYADGHESWFFDAFLMVDTQRSNKKFGNDISGIPASQVDWSWMLDQFYDTELKLHALDELISDKKASIGEPPTKHCVVLSLCLPTLASDGNWSRAAWGRINCLNINFRTLSNRVRAVQWYIDQMIERWQQQNYRNLKLVGVYWIEESIYTNSDLVKAVNNYVHSKGLRSYWIPFYYNNSSSWSQAHNYGFDVTYLQPNYAFYKSDGTLYPRSILDACCSNALEHNLGLEFEFETIETSSAMHEKNPELHQRIHDYLDAFEQYGVVEKGAIAYYTGSQGLIDMSKSSDPVNQATMDRLADIVAHRQSSRSGVDNPVADHRQIAYAGDGCIYICADTDTAQCFDLSGRLVYTGSGRFNCPAGVYLVKDSKGNCVKLAVK